MIKALIQETATKLATLNKWISEVRSVGYLTKIDESNSVVGTDLKDIGLTDVSGNSGYIRFKSDQNYSVREIPRLSTAEIAQEISVDLRLVLLVGTKTPEDAIFLLTIQLNSFLYSNYPNNNVRARVYSAGSNTINNHKVETGQQTINNSMKVVFVDFKIIFDYRQRCDTFNITFDMNCEECSNPLDFGCINYCTELELNQNADYSGEMTMNTKFNGITVTKVFEVISGEPISIPMDTITPNYEYLISLTDEAGEVVMIVDDTPSSNEYECFKINIEP